MMQRRQFAAALVGSLGGLLTGTPVANAAESKRHSPLFCASIGARLATYELDARSRNLRELNRPASAPAEVQCAWSDSARQTLYAACSDQQMAGADKHFLCAFRITPAGNLAPLATPVPLRSRPIYVTGDGSGAYLLTAYNRPSSISVHAIERNGFIGEEVPQSAALDAGVYAHQVKVFPSNRAVLLMARGNDAAAGRPEDAGALKIFNFAEGRLTNAQSVAPNQGRNFRPRHAAFHTSGHWVYVVLESGNEIQTYAVREDRLSDAPLFISSTLAHPKEPAPGQMASSIVMHPNGRTLYVANRGTGTEEFRGERVANEGENSLAVFSVNPDTGEPSLIQTIDARGIHVRSLDLSSDGCWLVAASISAAKVRGADRVRLVPAGLSLFKIGASGRLTFASKHDVDAPGQRVFWVGSLGNIEPAKSDCRIGPACDEAYQAERPANITSTA